ncbi:MAG: DUF6324 family protein [Pseudomonadota bacterium]
MGINSESDISATLTIGPTTEGMVRVYVEADGVEVPMDFFPEEAVEIAEELRQAAAAAEAAAAKGLAKGGRKSGQKRAQSSERGPGQDGGSPQRSGSGAGGRRRPGGR